MSMAERPRRGPGRFLSHALPRAGVVLLAVLLVADVAVIGLHLTRPEREFSLENDGGWGGWLGHLHLVLIIVLLMAAWRWSRAPVHLAWAGLFGVVLIDDRWLLHERGGVEIASALDFPAVLGLRSIDLGELAVWAVLGVAVLVPLALAHRRSRGPARVDSRRLLALLLALSFFAVVLDMLHIALGLPDEGMVAVEDGGELVVSSVLVYYASGLAAVQWATAASGGTIDDRDGRRPSPSTATANPRADRREVVRGAPRGRHASARAGVVRQPGATSDPSLVDAPPQVEDVSSLRPAGAPPM